MNHSSGAGEDKDNIAGWGYEEREREREREIKRERTGDRTRKSA